MKKYYKFFTQIS